MVIKIINAVLTVIAGMGAIVALFWLLNFLVERLPSRVEERLKPYIYILPAFAAISLFLLYPAVQTVINSFANATTTKWVGLRNYQDLFGSEDFRSTLLNTLLWMILVPALTIVLGLGVAVLADRLRPRAEKSAKTIIFLPMAISAVGAGTIWTFMYAFSAKGTTQVGLQNAIVTGLGADPVPWLQESTLHFNSLLLMVMLLWMQVGFSMVLLSSAIKAVPVDTVEAARIDGANERQIFRRVILPQIMGSIITVLITVTISVMKIFDIVYVMTNGDFNTNVVATEFFNQLTTFFDYGKSSAIVVLLMIAVIPILIYQVRHFRAEEAMR